MDFEFFFHGVGVFAALLTSTSFLPQIHKAYKSKSLGDLSWGLLLTFGSGVFCWLLYGLFRKDPIIIGANAFTFSNIAILVLQKYLYRNTAA
jgi:MtN3 and saliva related transmembrane protein